ncbi:hypothetical protein BpHYR1_035608, partial [Brachionus plicatilis]
DNLSEIFDDIDLDDLDELDLGLEETEEHQERLT